MDSHADIDKLVDCYGCYIGVLLFSLHYRIRSITESRRLGLIKGKFDGQFLRSSVCLVASSVLFRRWIVSIAVISISALPLDDSCLSQ